MKTIYYRSIKKAVSINLQNEQHRSDAILLDSIF